MALPYIKEVITKDYDLKENCKNGTDENRNIPRISKNILISFEELPDYDVAMYTHKKNEDKCADFT